MPYAKQRRNKAIEGHSLLCGLHRKPYDGVRGGMHFELPRVRPVAIGAGAVSPKVSYR